MALNGTKLGLPNRSSGVEYSLGRAVLALPQTLAEHGFGIMFRNAGKGWDAFFKRPVGSIPIHSRIALSA